MLHLIPVARLSRAARPAVILVWAALCFRVKTSLQPLPKGLLIALLTGSRQQAYNMQAILGHNKACSLDPGLSNQHNSTMLTVDAHLKVPARFSPLSLLVKGSSVPALRRTLYCIPLKRFRHSSSLSCTRLCQLCHVCVLSTNSKLCLLRSHFNARGSRHLALLCC